MHWYHWAIIVLVVIVGAAVVVALTARNDTVAEVLTGKAAA